MYATHCWIPVCPSQFWIMKNLEILKYSQILILFLVILRMTTFLTAVAFLQFWSRQQLMIQGNLTLYILIMNLVTSNHLNNVDVISI